MRRLPNAFSADSLRLAWRDSRDASTARCGAPGIDWLQASSFSGNLSVEIANIRSALHKDDFHFSKLRAVAITKSGGGLRILAIPTVRDRLVQRAILRHLDQDPKFNANSSISYGFTKGRSLGDAQRKSAELRNQYNWALKVDIVKFFDEIRRSDVKKLVSSTVRSKIISELLCQAVDCEIADSSGLSERIRENGIKRGRGLRQGMPVSPLLSNLLLKKFDQDLEKAGVTAIRYADDIIVFAKSRDECTKILNFLQEKLEPLGLKVPPLGPGSKTSIHEPSNPVEFLGLEIKRGSNRYELHIPSNKLASIDEKMLEIASVEYCTKYKKNIGHAVRHLDSYIAGYRASMDTIQDRENFFARLERMKHRNIERLIISLVGEEAFKALSPNHLAILGAREFQ